MDIKTAFLHGNLEELVYMVQPEGFIQPGQEHLVCKIEEITLWVEAVSKAVVQAF